MARKGKGKDAASENSEEFKAFENLAKQVLGIAKWKSTEGRPSSKSTETNDAVRYG